MRISDWSSDVCSADLQNLLPTCRNPPYSDIETKRYAFQCHMSSSKRTSFRPSYKRDRSKSMEQHGQEGQGKPDLRHFPVQAMAWKWKPKRWSHAKRSYQTRAGGVKGKSEKVQ